MTRKTAMMRGGMTQSNAGASVKPQQKGTPSGNTTMMRGGGMAKKKK
tara:strand:+ start:1284 stop:1424 length:141 start_codon:yes stop_codon:yes gene_type:complete